MTDKKKPHTAGTGTASKPTFDSRNHTATDPLLSRIDPVLAAHLGLLALAVFLLMGGAA